MVKVRLLKEPSGGSNTYHAPMNMYTFYGTSMRDVMIPEDIEWFKKHGAFEIVGITAIIAEKLTPKEKPVEKFSIKYEEKYGVPYYGEELLKEFSPTRMREIAAKFNIKHKDKYAIIKDILDIQKKRLKDIK